MRVEEVTIKQVKKFNYLGIVITSDGKCGTEIKRRIGMAKDHCFQKIGKMFKDRKMSMKVKTRLCPI